MNEEELKVAIQNLGTWNSKGKVSPHKPLLILYAISRLVNERLRWIPYIEVKRDLRELLSRFSNSYHPEYPYVYLKSDGFWVLNREVGTKFSIKELNKTSGGFTELVFNLLTHNPLIVEDLVNIILDQYFAETQFEDILERLGLTSITLRKRQRSPLFRTNVLRTYGYRCAVCGFNLHINHSYVGLEAAHIKWHKRGGPDTEDNGLSLCSLHHTLFDYGTFTLGRNNIIIVSASALSYGEPSKVLFDYHGKEILKPQSPEHHPNKVFIEWHNDEIFKKPGRYLG